MVNAILLGNNRRLQRAFLSEIIPGQRVLQVAHVYGRLILEIAELVGPTGYLDVIDVVPLQAALCRRKLRGFAGPAMAAIEDTWQALGHTKRELEDAYECLMKSGALENWAGKKHVDLD